jgi:hypothetical protein
MHREHPPSYKESTILPSYDESQKLPQSYAPPSYDSTTGRPRTEGEIVALLSESYWPPERQGNTNITQAIINQPRSSRIVDGYEERSENQLCVVS